MVQGIPGLWALNYIFLGNKARNWESKMINLFSYGPPAPNFNKRMSVHLFKQFNENDSPSGLDSVLKGVITETQELCQIILSYKDFFYSRRFSIRDDCEQKCKNYFNFSGIKSKIFYNIGNV